LPKGPRNCVSIYQFPLCGFFTHTVTHINNAYQFDMRDLFLGRAAANVLRTEFEPCRPRKTINLVTCGPDLWVSGRVQCSSAHTTTGFSVTGASKVLVLDSFLTAVVDSCFLSAVFDLFLAAPPHQSSHLPMSHIELTLSMSVLSLMASRSCAILTRDNLLPQNRLITTRDLVLHSQPRVQYPPFLGTIFAKNAVVT